MKRWIPPTDQVGPKEQLGRRLFDEPMLVGATDSKRFAGLDLRNFEETRNDEFSVDRLGRYSVNESVVRFLRPLADASARTFHPSKKFDGWVALQAEKLEKSIKGTPLPVVPSPDEHNPYHAHADTGKMLESAPDRQYYIALRLRQLFASKGKVHPVAGQTKNEGFSQFLPPRLKRWLSERFKIQIIV